MKYLLTDQESQRLKFRLLERSDFNTWLTFFEDESVAGFMGLTHIKTPRERCEKWFEICEDRYKNNLGGLNVLIDKASNQFIGQCGLLVQDVDGQEELEIGYSILPQFRNMGYASEAAQKCRDFAFAENYADSIISIVHLNNSKSEKVALKNGMKKSRQTTFNGMPVNIFRIDKADWAKLNKNE